jgi:hypothetical protein
MTEDKIITLRFKTSSVPDMEPYRKLECERNCLGVSMPVCVKGILRDHFAGNGTANSR